jgi:hypothetical protein
VAFDVASVVWIEVDEMGVEGESGKAEKEGAVWSEGMREVGVSGGCKESIESSAVCESTHDPSTSRWPFDQL